MKVIHIQLIHDAEKTAGDRVWSYGSRISYHRPTIVPGNIMDTTLFVLVSVGLVSLASFVGVFTIPLHGDRLRRALCFLIPLAVGALLGDAFFHLVPEAFEESGDASRASLLIIIGIASFFLLEKFLRWHHHPAERDAQEAPRNQAAASHLGQLVLISDGLHNFIDGIIIGASYLVSIEVGIATTLAVILHEIPQEIGDFGILLYAGYKKRTALFYNFLSAITAVAGALLVLLMGSLPPAFIQSVLPFAAGSFIYIAGSDLVPELHRNREHGNLFAEIGGIALGVFLMYLLLFLE